jgi:hypothetical protein
VELLRVGSLHAQSCNQVDQRRIHSNLPIDPQVLTMIALREEFNASVNLLMLAKMMNLHHVKYSGLHEIFNPWLGDYVRILPSGLHQVSVGCDHGIVISISKVKFVVLQC